MDFYRQAGTLISSSEKQPVEHREWLEQKFIGVRIVKGGIGVNGSWCFDGWRGCPCNTLQILFVADAKESELFLLRNHPRFTK